MIDTIQRQVIKTITTYEHKNKHFKRIGKPSNAKRKRDTGVLVFSRQFKVGQSLKPFSSVKKQGNPLLSVPVAMILSRLGGMSVSGMQQTGRLGMDENTVYRLMNNPLVDRKSLLLSFAGQFISCVSQRGGSDKKSVKWLCHR